MRGGGGLCKETKKKENYKLKDAGWLQRFIPKENK